MNAKEWLSKNNIDLNRYCGNIGDYDGNICIEVSYKHWEFWGKDGNFEKIILE